VAGRLGPHQRPPPAAGRRPAQEAAHDLLQPEAAVDQDYYEPWTYDYETLLNAPRSDTSPSPGQVADHRQADERRVVGQLGRRPRRLAEHAAKDPMLKGIEDKVKFEFEQTFMFYLPRICEHCLNPSCAASCPSAARSTSAPRTASSWSTRTAAAAGGCASPAARTRRSTSTTRPARPRSAPSATRASRSASRRCARRPAWAGCATSGSSSTTPTRCSRPRHRGRHDLYEAQLLFLDPDDPEVRREPRRRPASRVTGSRPPKSPGLRS
jgi:nitrate reductase beta subunit